LLQGKHNTSLSEIDQIATMEIARYDCSYQDPAEPKIIIVVPYRHRELDLLSFILHMVPYFRHLVRQMEILVAEQNGTGVIRLEERKTFKPGDGNDLVLWYFAYFMQMIWYYGIPGLLYADDLVLWYSAYFTQMIWYYGIPPPRKKAKERTESVLNCALTGVDGKCPKWFT
uniref:Glyco_transf_7N domain-containing protein n=1 Tax=Rodentolepis nana TaxID=102285 RepID=A0A0R3TI62_RODNA